MYLIGDILNKFTKNSVAYCINGVSKDSFIMCNTLEENRLYRLKPNGDISYDFYFGVPSEPSEADKQWIFLNEIDDLELAKKVNKQLTESIIESLKKGYKYYTDSEDKN